MPDSHPLFSSGFTHLNSRILRALVGLESSPTQNQLSDYLSRRGFEVTTSDSLESAWDFALTQEFDLILVDRLLPSAGDFHSTLGFCRKLRNHQSLARAYLVILTLSQSELELQVLADSGADDFITFPLESDQLHSRLYLAEQRIRSASRDRRAPPTALDLSSAEDLYAVAEASPVMLWIADREGHCSFFNQSYLDYTGRKLEQELGMGWAEAIHPEDYSRSLDTYLRAVEDRSEFRSEYRLRCADGSFRWTLAAGVPRRGPRGEFLGFIGSCVDISDHKRSEAILRDSEERLRLVIKNMPVMMVAFDEGGRIIVWNRECERVTGYRADEMIDSDRVADLFVASDEDQTSELRARWAEPNAYYRDLELEFLCRNGEVCTVAWSNISRDLRIPGWTSWGIGVNVTERQRAEEERLRLDGEIQRAQKLESLEMLAGGIAHDFNNLLVSILGKANLARLELSPQSSAYELIEQVEEAAQLAAELTNQMLAYSGKGRFIVEPVSLSKAVDGIHNLLEVNVSKEIKVIYKLDHAAKPIEADVTKIQQVAMNLIANAAEAIGKKPGRIVVRTGTLYADRNFLSHTHAGEELPEGEYSYLQISDTGCGMNPEPASKIFDPFFTTKFTGRGLGLAAVLGIVRSHQGSLRVNSLEGQGTEFMVLFPCSESPEAVTDSATTESTPSSVDAAVVLVVDDEEAVRNVARQMLERYGYEVVTAVDGVDGLEKFQERNQAVDAVLLDLTMPRLNGEDTLRELRRLDSSLPVVLSSGFSEQEIRGRFHGDTPTSFLQKPYTAKTLAEIIAAAIANTRDGQSAERVT